MSFVPFSVGAVTCAGTSTCYALGLDNSGQAGVASVSTDRGATWRLLALPPRTPQPGLYDISCPTAQACWIAGEQAVPQVIPGRGYNGSSAMILATSDGGASWSKTTFAAQRLASGEQADSLMAVGEIACPAVDSCVGIGVRRPGLLPHPRVHQRWRLASSRPFIARPDRAGQSMMPGMHRRFPISPPPRS